MNTETTETKRQMTQSNRLLLWIGGGIVALVVAAAIVVAAAEPASFEPGSPEAVVQQYIEAVLDEDPDAAHVLLTPRLQAECSVDELEPRYRRADTGRIVLVDSRVREQTATIELEFSAASADGAFDVYRYEFLEQFRLRLVDGSWRISEIPWPYFWCSGV